MWQLLLQLWCFQKLSQHPKTPGLKVASGQVQGVLSWKNHTQDSSSYPNPCPGTKDLTNKTTESFFIFKNTPFYIYILKKKSQKFKARLSRQEMLDWAQILKTNVRFRVAELHSTLG